MSVTLILGFIFGILSALFFAFYMVPQKIVRQDTPTFLWWMSLGVLVTAAIPYVALGCPMHADWAARGTGLFCGVVWALGTLSFAAGIMRIGLAQATPIKNTTGVLGTLVGLIAFAEWRTTDPILCLLGSVAIVLSAILIGATTPTEPRPPSAAGVLFALGAAVCYATYLYPMKLVLELEQVSDVEFTIWMAAGIFGLTTTTVLATRRAPTVLAQPPRAALMAMLGGVSWALALFCLAASINYAGLAIAWSLAQLNTIPAVFIGMFTFHEVRWTTQWRKITLGMIAAVIGTILLALSK
jgi:glucose uptake protein GlcU